MTDVSNNSSFGISFLFSVTQLCKGQVRDRDFRAASVITYLAQDTRQDFMKEIYMLRRSEQLFVCIAEKGLVQEQI